MAMGLRKSHIFGRRLMAIIPAFGSDSNWLAQNFLPNAEIALIDEEKARKLKPGRVSAAGFVPNHIKKPPYIGCKRAPEQLLESQVHTKEGLVHMRAACRLAAEVLDYAGSLVKPGITTDAIDKAVHKLIIDRKAYPSPLGYYSNGIRFPKSICTSVNECICHGMPDSRQLQNGDILNIDITVFLNGYHGDTSATFICGSSEDEKVKKLIEVCRECVDKAVGICAAGVDYMRIGQTIQRIADEHGYGIVRDFIGHGVGPVFHSAPAILPHRNKMPGTMQLGETFTIEPILTMGGIEHNLWKDGWTVVTKDRSWTAQFEHTILIKECNAEILTVSGGRRSFDFL